MGDNEGDGKNEHRSKKTSKRGETIAHREVYFLNGVGVCLKQKGMNGRKKEQKPE